MHGCQCHSQGYLELGTGSRWVQLCSAWALPDLGCPCVLVGNPGISLAFPAPLAHQGLVLTLPLPLPSLACLPCSCFQVSTHNIMSRIANVYCPACRAGTRPQLMSWSRCCGQRAAVLVLQGPGACPPGCQCLRAWQPCHGGLVPDPGPSLAAESCWCSDDPCSPTQELGVPEQ